MKKAEIIKVLKDDYNFEAREDLHVSELELILEAFESRPKIQEFVSTIEDMQSEVAKAVETAESAEKTAGKTTIDFEGKTFEVLAKRFRLPNNQKIYTTEDLKSKEVVSELLKIEGQNVIKEI